MRLTTICSTLLLAVSFTVHSYAQQWGDVKVKFVYGGDPPAAKAIKATRDQAFCGQHKLVDETLVVSKDGGIKNFVLYAYEGRGGIELASKHPDSTGKSKTLTLDNKGCRFEPRIVITQPGDSLDVLNSDTVGHNANLNFISNKAQNITIPPKGKQTVKLEVAEPAPIPVECNIHPWMAAKVLVLDHGYAASSAADGTLTIKNLPVGKVALRIYHEGSRRLAGLEVGGEEVNRRNVIELDIKAGANDLGVVKVDPKFFAE